MAELESQPLSDEERAELEELRAEKARREAREEARREREELAALRAMPNVILTDHTAFYTYEDVKSMVRGVLESAVAFEKGQPTRHDVTDL